MIFGISQINTNIKKSMWKTQYLAEAVEILDLRDVEKASNSDELDLQGLSDRGGLIRKISV